MSFVRLSAEADWASGLSSVNAVLSLSTRQQDSSLLLDTGNGKKKRKGGDGEDEGDDEEEEEEDGKEKDVMDQIEEPEILELRRVIKHANRNPRTINQFVKINPYHLADAPLQPPVVVDLTTEQEEEEQREVQIADASSKSKVNIKQESSTSASTSSTEIKKESLHIIDIPQCNWEDEVNSMIVDGDEYTTNNTELKPITIPVLEEDEEAENMRQIKMKQEAEEVAKKSFKRSLPLSAVGLDCVDLSSTFEIGVVDMQDATYGNPASNKLIPNVDDIYEIDAMEEVGMLEDARTVQADAKGVAVGESSMDEQGSLTTGMIIDSVEAPEQKKGGRGGRKAKSVETLRKAAVQSNLDMIEMKKNRFHGLKTVNLSKFGEVAMTSAQINSGRNATDRFGGRLRTRGEVIKHARVAAMHYNTQSDLYSKHLRSFHRPKLTLGQRTKPWKVAVKWGSPSKWGDTNRRRALEYSNMSIENADLNVAVGNIILLEYIEENPPLRLNFGMTSKIINYYRAPDSREAEDVEEEEEEKQARKKRVKMKREELYNQCRVPRHLQLLLEHRDRKKGYDFDANTPRLPIGKTQVLNHNDPSPFLGELEEEEILPTITSTLFKAPIFEHRAKTTDFLLVKYHSDGGEEQFVVRKIPHLYVCGQMEPLVRVPMPLPAKDYSAQGKVGQVQSDMIKLAIARYFTYNMGDNLDSTGASMKEIESSILSDYTRDHHWSPHREGLRHHFHRLLSEQTSVIDRRGGDRRYRYRVDDDDDWDDDGNVKNKSERLAPESLARAVRPEDVCAEEAKLASEFMLREWGIEEALPLHELVSWLQLMGRLRTFREHRAAYALYLSEYYAKAHSSWQAKVDSVDRSDTEAQARIRREISDSSRKATLFKKVSDTFIHGIIVLDQKIEVGRFIIDRLVYAPWNTTDAYISSYHERDGHGRMQLSGVGDPSGCGEGFAFVRMNDPEPEEQRTAPISAAKAKQGPQLYKTDADLRKLKNPQAIKLLVAYGVSYEEARDMQRWDRVMLIRTFATAAANMGVDAKNKFARTGAVQLGGSRQVGFMSECQKIWDKQKEALSRKKGNLLLDGSDTQTSSRGKILGEGDEGMDEDGKEKVDAEEGDDDDSGSDSDFDISVDDYVERCVKDKSAEIWQEQLTKEKESVRRKKEDEDKRELKSMRMLLGDSDTGNISSSSVKASAIKPPAVTTTTSVEFSSPGAAPAGEDIISPGRPRTPSISLAVVSGATPTATMQEAPGLLPLPLTTSQSDLIGAIHTPAKVVRQIVRRVFKDGSEEVVVRFMVSEREVNRVRKDKITDNNAIKRRTKRYATVEDMDDAGDLPAGTLGRAGGPAGSLSIKFGKMKNAIVRKGQETGIYGAGGIDEYKRRQSSSRGAEFPVYRLPHVALAARFEREIMNLVRGKHTPEFWMLWNPVPNTVLTYYQYIAHPISLSDIRENIINFKYLSYKAFQIDLDLMVDNAIAYNGVGSKIALKAKDLRKRLTSALEHDRNQLGLAYCPIRNLEEAVRKKWIYIGRVMPPLQEYGEVLLPGAKLAAQQAREKAAAAGANPDNSSSSGMTSGSGLVQPDISGGIVQDMMPPDTAISQSSASSFTPHTESDNTPFSPPPGDLSKDIPMQRGVSFNPMMATLPSSSSFTNLAATHGSLANLGEMSGLASTSPGGFGQDYSPLATSPGAGGDTSPLGEQDYSPAFSDDMSPPGGATSPYEHPQTSPYSAPSEASPGQDGVEQSPEGSRSDATEDYGAFEDGEEAGEGGDRDDMVIDESGNIGRVQQGDEEEEDDDWQIDSDDDED